MHNPCGSINECVQPTRGKHNLNTKVVHDRRQFNDGRAGSTLGRQESTTTQMATILMVHDRCRHNDERARPARGKHKTRTQNITSAVHDRRRYYDERARSARAKQKTRTRESPKWYTIDVKTTTNAHFLLEGTRGRKRERSLSGYAMNIDTSTNAHGPLRGNRSMERYNHTPVSQIPILAKVVPFSFFVPSLCTSVFFSHAFFSFLFFFSFRFVSFFLFFLLALTLRIPLKTKRQTHKPNTPNTVAPLDGRLQRR